MRGWEGVWAMLEVIKVTGNGPLTLTELQLHPPSLHSKKKSVGHTLSFGHNPTFVQILKEFSTHTKQSSIYLHEFWFILIVGI